MININTYEMQYAGANNPLYIVNAKSDLSVISPDKMPIAIYENMNPFTNYSIQLQKGDTIYLLSDGYQDQFGGPNNKKFMSRQLKKLLVDNSHKSIIEQKHILETTLQNWIGEGSQIDDITVMGIRI